MVVDCCLSVLRSLVHVMQFLTRGGLDENHSFVWKEHSTIIPGDDRFTTVKTEQESRLHDHFILRANKPLVTRHQGNRDRTLSTHALPSCFSHRHWSSAAALSNSCDVMSGAMVIL